MTICGGTNTIAGGRMLDLGDAVLLGGDHQGQPYTPTWQPTGTCSNGPSKPFWYKSCPLRWIPGSGSTADLGDAVLLGGDHLSQAARLLLLPVQLHLHLDVVVVHHLFRA